MFFQTTTTPDTSGYMIAGYAVAFIVMGIYVVSMYLRQRNLDQDMSMLQEMEKTAAEKEAAKPRKAATTSGSQKTAEPVTNTNRQKQP